MTSRKVSLSAAFAAVLTAALFTCDTVPDYCGTGEVYDPSCEFCFGSRAYPLCSNGKYNPLTNGCDTTSGLIGTRCSDGTVVPSGTPCGGYTLTVAATPEEGGRVTRTYSERTNFAAGEDVILSAIPSSIDFKFVGWAGALASGGEVASYTMKGNNPQIAIVAMFKSTVKGRLITEAFPKAAGETTRDPEKDIYDGGDNVTVRAAAKSGYLFSGWSGVAGADASKNPLTIRMDSSRTLVAMFEPAVHKLETKVTPSDGGAVFINGNAVAGNAAQDVGADISILALEADGYRFKEWRGTPSSAVEFVDKNSISTTVKLKSESVAAEITAVFERGASVWGGVTQAVICTLTVDANPSGVGGVTLSPNGGIYTAGTRVTATAAFASGYIFNGWTGSAAAYMNDQSANPAMTTAMGGRQTLTANYLLQSGGGGSKDTVYTITFDANWTGGTVTPSSGTTNTSGYLVANLPEPTRSGYEFIGWYTDAVDGDWITAGTAGTKFSGNATIYAHWKEETPVATTYTITFNANGGSVSPASGTTNTSGYLTSLPTPSRSGYTFDGWYTSSSGGTSVTATSYKFSSSITIYAHWKEETPVAKTYTLKLESSPAAGGTTVQGKYTGIEGGTDVDITATAASGYTFEKWTVSGGGGTIANSTSASTTVRVNGDVTVTAYFTQNGTGGGGSGTFVDGRDGKTYKKVTIGGQTWMGENLNYQPSTGNSWCYNGKDENCAKYGRLYTWKAAMDGSSSSTLNPSGVKGVCPTGWHLPSSKEWDGLVGAAGGYSTAGKKLKSTSGWNSNGNGTDDYGFSALPGGDRGSDGSFYDAGRYGSWWTATEGSESDAYYRGMGYDYDFVYEGSIVKSIGFSVRCVQD